MIRQTFTPAQREALQATRAAIALRLHRPVELETCADDGDEWAAFTLSEFAPEGFAPLVTVQATRDPMNPLALLGTDGRQAPWAVIGESLAALPPMAARVATVSAQALAPLARGRQ